MFVTSHISTVLNIVGGSIIGLEITSTVSGPLPSTVPPPGIGGGVSTTVVVAGEKASCFFRNRLCNYWNTTNMLFFFRSMLPPAAVVGVIIAILFALIIFVIICTFLYRYQQEKEKGETLNQCCLPVWLCINYYLFAVH